jgi:ABC-type phosphate transport system ATPase subunit
MDEASSALHPVAYERIQTAIKERFKHCTVLSVAVSLCAL